MKNLILVGGLMLGLGFAIGWVAKPVPAVDQTAEKGKARESQPRPASPVTQAEAVPAAPGKRAIREPATEKPDSAKDKQMEQAKKMQAEMSKQMTKRQRDKLMQHIDKLAEALGLTDAQKMPLTDWVEANMAKMEGMDFTKPESMKGMMELMKTLTPKAVQDQLAPSLTEEQKVALKDFTDREHRTKVDAAALKNLSKLQGVIEFGEGQRDQIYEILSAGADESLKAREEKPDPTSFFMEGMGMDMDPYDLGLQSAMTEMMGDDPAEFAKSGGDQKEMAGKLREVFDKKIDAKVEALRPVLNEKQLEQYRAELKTKGLGMYGTMLMGLEASDGK
ncbi:MAG: hypothetical protein EOP87_06295 [Verrucomicrobiaceae bacterium]|nr:MAG: hypothetical protein EOP87_06295 [Verrucomicrobiaceae bacterium]